MMRFPTHSNRFPSFKQRAVALGLTASLLSGCSVMNAIRESAAASSTDGSSPAEQLRKSQLAEATRELGVVSTAVEVDGFYIPQASKTNVAILGWQPDKPTALTPAVNPTTITVPLRIIGCVLPDITATVNWSEDKQLADVFNYTFQPNADTPAIIFDSKAELKQLVGQDPCVALGN